MRLGSNQRIIALTSLFIFFFSIFIPVQKVYSNPLLVTRAVLPTVLGRVISSRALQVTTTESAYSLMVRNTSTAISKTVLSKSPSIASKGFFRSASGALTWAGVGYSVGSLTAENFSDNGRYLIATSGKALGNGKWEVNFGDKTFTVDFEPTPDNPFVISADSLNMNSYDTVDKVSAGYRWWQCNYGTSCKGPFIVGSVTGVAQGYFNSVASGGGLTCRAPDKSCSYKLNILSVNEGQEGSSSSVKYSYTSSYTNSDGELISSTYTPIQGIQVFYNKDFDKAFEVLFSDYKMATDDDGFSVMDGLKKVPMDLDTLAKMINNLLMDAASQPDYQGVPVSSTNPVTSNEIKVAYPNYGALTKFDYMYPSQNSPSADVNISAPGFSPGGSGGGSDNGSTNPDFSHPDVPEPTLDTPPSAEEILRPIKELFGQYRDLEVRPSGLSASCPVAKFNVFDRDYVIDMHCVFLEEYRSFIGIISSLIWALISLRILLST